MLQFPSSHIMPMTRLHAKILVSAFAISLLSMVQGCAVVSATAGAAISVTSAVVSTGIRVTGAVVEAGIDAVSDDDSEE